MWEVDEGSVDKPRIGRGSASERFRRRRCGSMHEGELLPEVSTTRIDVGFVFSLRSWGHDSLTFRWPSSWSSSPKSRQVDHGEASSPCFYCQYWWPNSGEYSFFLFLSLCLSIIILVKNVWLRIHDTCICHMEGHIKLWCWFFFFSFVPRRIFGCMWPFQCFSTHMISFHVRFCLFWKNILILNYIYLVHTLTSQYFTSQYLRGSLFR